MTWRSERMALAFFAWLAMPSIISTFFFDLRNERWCQRRRRA
jgi:hypothetical protein